MTAVASLRRLFATQRSAARSRHLHLNPVVPLAWLGLTLICAIFGEWIAPHDAERPDPVLFLIPPVWESGGSFDYILGTDAVGRDILSRLIVGARVSLLVGVSVVALAGVIGTLVALVSGYFGRWVDALLMRITDAFMSLPFLVVAVALAGIIGPSTRNLIIVLSVFTWATYARVLRSEVIRLREADFIVLARITGAPAWRILLHHLLPNVVNTLIVLLTLQVGIAIIAAASLGFLGLGVPPPTPEWGAMLSDGRQYISSAWWVVTMPGIALALTVMSFNLLGDWLRTRLDPREQGL